MKRLFIIVYLIFVTTVSMAEWAYDIKTDRSYSKNPSRIIDQNEYASLAVDLRTVCQGRSFLHYTASEQAWIFSCLKAVGTPAALQFIDDLEQYIKDYKKYIKSINSL